MKRDLGSSSLSGRKNLIFFIFWKFFRHPRGAGKEREGMMKKYIFVTGGVISGLGKGITAAALGRLLKSRGYKVASQKLDPYINIDPGTMSRISTARCSSRRTARRRTWIWVITSVLSMRI